MGCGASNAAAVASPSPPDAPLDPADSGEASLDPTERQRREAADGDGSELRFAEATAESTAVTEEQWQDVSLMSNYLHRLGLNQAAAARCAGNCVASGVSNQEAFVRFCLTSTTFLGSFAVVFALDLATSRRRL